MFRASLFSRRWGVKGWKDPTGAEIRNRWARTGVLATLRSRWRVGSRQPSERVARSSGSCSERPSNCQSRPLSPLMNCSVTASTTHAMRGPRSREAGIGKRNIGSAPCVTMRSHLPVAVWDSMALTAETSTDCPWMLWVRPAMHSCVRLIETNLTARWRVQLPPFSENRRRRERWPQASKDRFVRWRQDG